jgi:L-iditol 2-dehydrogenase
MRAAVLQRPGVVTIEERADPEPGPDEVLVRVAAVGICGSDVHYYRHGRIGRYVVEQPLVLGHESSGTIAALGAGVPTARLGERVAVEPGVPCRRCDWCKRGRYNLCPLVVFLGTPPVDGALVEYLSVPADFAHPVPDTMTFDDAALVEPTAVAVHAARVGRTAAGEHVAVFGAGPIGLLLTQVVRAFGAASVVVVDPEPLRRELAGEFGADDAIAPDDVNAREGTADIAFDASGDPGAIAATVGVARRGGRAVWVGLPPGAVPLPVPAVVDKDALLTHRFELAETGQALDQVAAREGGVVKAVIHASADS